MSRAPVNVDRDFRNGAPPRRYGASGLRLHIERDRPFKVAGMALLALFCVALAIVAMKMVSPQI
ncbi:MAG: hypothetical protein ACK5JM_09355 [Rhodoblastus sp.]